MPRIDAVPTGWDRISRTTENPLSVMTLYGLLGLKHFRWDDGQEWPPRVPNAPDPIFYANVKSIDTHLSDVTAIPPQALVGAFQLPPPSISFPGLAAIGGEIGPVRLAISADSIDGNGNRSNIFQQQAEVASTSLVGGLSPNLVMPVSELAKMKQALTSGPSATWTVEVTVAVQCAQPFKNPNPLRREADWFWVETARSVASVRFDLLKPEFVVMGERLMAEVADASAATGRVLVQVQQASADAAAAMAGAAAASAEAAAAVVGVSGVQAGLGQVQQDVVALKGDLLAKIQDFRVELPDLVDFYAKQGIKDSLQGYVTQTDLDGVIKAIAVERQGDVEKLHQDMAFQGATLREMVRGEVYSVREDIAATDARVEALRNLLFSEIKPLRTAVGQQLTREEVEKIVESKIEALRASLTPPIPRAFLLGVAGPPTLPAPGSVAKVTATLNVVDGGMYDLPPFFSQQRLTPGSYQFTASRTISTAGAYSEKYVLKGRGQDGSWNEIGAATWSVYVAPILMPATGEAPDLALDWSPPPSIPAGVSYVWEPAFWVTLNTPFTFAGTGFSYGYSILINQQVSAVQWGGLTAGKWPARVRLDLSTIGLPQRDQQITVDAITVILDSSGNIWGNPKRFHFVYPYSVVYPVPKVAGALRPPLESPPGGQFPVIVVWDNASGVPGVIRVGGVEVNAPAGPSSIALVGEFPDGDVDYADMSVPVEVKGPGGAWEKTDGVSYRTFRAPPTMALDEISVPASSPPGEQVALRAAFAVEGLPVGKSVQVRLLMGDTVLASGPVGGNGAAILAGNLSMPNIDLLGTVRLQVMDAKYGGVPGWITRDARFMFVRVEVPLPTVNMNFPSVVPAGEPVVGSVSFGNIGATGRITGAFMQSQVFDSKLSQGEMAVFQAQLASPMWDDGRLVAQALGGRTEMARGDALVRVAFPDAALAVLEAPARARPGVSYSVRALAVNRGALGRIGVVMNGARQDEKVGEASERTFVFSWVMPPSEKAIVEAMPLYVGRFQLDVVGDSLAVSVEPEQAAFVSQSGLRLYGSPGMALVGAVIAKRLRASGWDAPMDGEAGPAAPFIVRFGGYGPAVLEAEGLRFLYLEVLRDSSVGDFAVVEDGTLVNASARRYVWNRLASAAMAPARSILAAEARLGLPPMMRGMAKIGGGFAGVVGAPLEALPLLYMVDELRKQQVGDG